METGPSPGGRSEGPGRLRARNDQMSQKFGPHGLTIQPSLGVVPGSLGGGGGSRIFQSKICAVPVLALAPSSCEAPGQASGGSGLGVQPVLLITSDMFPAFLKEVCKHSFELSPAL